MNLSIEECVVTRNHKANDSISNQGNAYTDCYNVNYKKYDWLLFFDIDEFLAIDNNILKYL